MKKISLILFVAMIITTNIRSQINQYQIANIPIQDRTLVLDSAQVRTSQLRTSKVKVYSTETSSILPTTFLSNQADSTAATSRTSISTFAASVSTSRSVGKINYTSGVSPNGAAYIDIPIELPKAPIGFTPELSFTYNSMAGRSDLGQGWLLSGLSSITRTNKNKYYDNNPEGLNSTWSDAYSLDGTRLIRTSTGSTEDYYVSESGNIKVVAYNKTIDSKLTISHFKVTYPNGLIATYGFSTETVLLSTYPITQITDPLGNSATFTYDIHSHNGNHYRITGIQYGKNKEYQVEVKYRGCGTIGGYDEYIGGYKYRREALIEYVNVKYNSNLLRTYTLSHGMSETRPLQSISLSNGSSSMNTLNFTYGDDNQSKAFKSNGTSQMMYWYNFTDPTAIRTVRGKFDYGSQADGLLVLPNKIPYLEYKSGSTNYIYSKYTGTEDIMISSGLADDMSMGNPKIKTGVGFVDILTANLDQFEEEEIIKINNYVSGSYDRLEFYVYTPNLYYGLVQKYKRTFDFSTLVDVNGRKSVTPKRFFTGDFNGDGKIELLVVSGYNTMGKGNSTKIYLFDLESNTKLYEGSNFNYYFLTPGEASAGRNQATIINSSDELLVGDFNGDGKSDILLIGASNTRLFSFGSSNTITTTFTTTAVTRSTYKDRFIMSGDFTGDGKTDLLLAPIYNSSSYNWTIYASTGLGFYSTTQSISGAYNKDKMDYSVQDINRDGITDLTKTDQSLSGNTLYSVYSIFNGKHDGTASVILTKNSITVPISLQSSNDFNSLIVVPPSGGKIARYSYNYDHPKANVLTSFTNSLGITTSFKYNRLNEKYNENGSFYQAGYDATFPFYNYDDASFMVATSHKETVNSLTTKDLRYSYTNAVMHKHGLGFQGFGQVTTYNNISYNDSETVTNDPYNWGVMKSKKSINGSTFENIYDYNVTVNTDKTKRITLKNKTEKDFLKGFTTISQYAYDLYDNQVKEIIDYGSGIKTTKDKKYNYHTGASLYSLSEICEEIETNENNGLSHVSKKVFSFNAARQPLSIKSYVNNNLVEDIANTYVSNNLTQTKKQQYTSGNSFTTKYTYDANGRVLRQTDPIGIFTDKVYNTKGEIGSIKDHKGLETKYIYDGWGVLTSITHPDGKVESSTEAWGSYGLICQTANETNKPTTKKYYNALEQVIRTSEIRFDGKELKTDYQYDNLGRLAKSSLPYTGASATHWNSYSYDSYNRITSLTYASGKKNSYSYNKNSTTSIIEGITETKTVDALGQITTLIDATGSTTYKYRPDKQLISITAVGNITTTFEYDIYGRKTAIVDPSVGRRSYTYDPSGNITKETDARGKVISMGYDTYNRPANKIIDGVTTTIKYNTDGLIEALTSTDGVSKTLTYDTKFYDKLKVEKETIIDGKWLEKTFVYNATSGVIESISYKSSESSNVNIGTESYTYANGHLKEIKFAGATVWRLDAETVLGTHSQVTTGALTRTYTYDQYGIPTGRNAKVGTAVIQSFSYNINPQTGNLNWRKDDTRNIQENFSYDNMNRLTSFGGKTVSYAPNGNILGISSVGTFGYNSSKPYAIGEFTPSGTSQIPLRDQTITYNSLMRPLTIAENNYVTTFSYNGDGARIKMVQKKNGADDLTRYYLNGGQYEIDRGVAGVKERLYIGGNSYSAAVVYVKEGSTWTLNYLCRDYLGSITHVTNASGAVRQELSYDAWGRLRNPVNQAIYVAGSEPTLLLGRGYTGHEHLTMYGLINMNSRLYDPVLGRFLSADPYIQEPFNSQSLNRYSYCLNNPLKYNDVNGELFGFISGFIRGIIKNPLKPHKWASTAMEGLLFDFKIVGGLLQGKITQTISRLTWELPQTICGLVYNLGTNWAGGVRGVSYWGGATVVQNAYLSGSMAVTLGSFIQGSKDIKADPYNTIFQHEYGHYLQSQKFGWGYLSKVGIPSLFSAKNAEKKGLNHSYHPVEQDANMRAFKYFNKHVDGFYKTETEYDQKNIGWNFDKNPLNFVKPDGSKNGDGYVDYENKDQMALVNSLKVKPGFIDYFAGAMFFQNPLWVVGVGVVNSNQKKYY